MLVPLIIFGVWLMVLSVAFYLFLRFFQKLVKGTKENELLKILTKILKVQEENSGSIFALEKNIKRLDQENTNHVQKIGIVRFNPFKEIGGDHSFSLALLDGEGSGVIITCLHTRERTRVYMKGIERGKCELELSVEEKKALEKANKG